MKVTNLGWIVGAFLLALAIESTTRIIVNKGITVKIIYEHEGNWEDYSDSIQKPNPNNPCGGREYTLGQPGKPRLKKK